MFLLGLAAVVTTNLLAGETLKIKLVTDREVVLKDAPSEVVVKIDLSAIVEKKKSQRTPLNLAVVLDHFGSMTGAKLEKTKQAAMQLVDHLAPDDIFSLIAFNIPDQARQTAERSLRLQLLRHHAHTGSDHRAAPQKLGDQGGEPKHLHTIRGVGYKLVV